MFLADPGEEGLRLPEGGGFDVVLCHLRVPGMSGHEFYRRLQSVDSPVVQRLVFMMGDVMSPEARNFLAEAGRPVLPKPFALQELLDAVSQVVVT
ncbi:MAG: response regulator [Gemmatimonadota bacterium]